MATLINAAAVQALAAYGGPPRASTGAAASYGLEQARRETVRHGAGVTVELSADARASLIEVQSAAGGPGPSLSPTPPPAEAGSYERPGSRLDLSI